MKFTYKDALITIGEESIIMENSGQTYIIYEENYNSGIMDFEELINYIGVIYDNYFNAIAKTKEELS